MKRINLITTVLMSLAAATLQAQDFTTASGSIDADLQASLDQLAALRAQISEEKLPLSRDINDLEKRVLQKSREANRLLKVRDSRTIALAGLERQVNSLEETNKYISDRLTEYVNSLNSQMSISERQHYGEQIDKAKLAPTNVNLTEEEKILIQLDTVDMALERLESQLGGFTFEGSALSPDGVLKEGKFLALGPSLYFSTPDGSVAGLIEDISNVSDPVVVPLPESMTRNLIGLINDGEGTFPADATGGKAIKVEKQKETYFEHIQKGRIVGYVIICLGIFSVLLALFKVYEIGSFPTVAQKDVQATLDLLADGKQEEALERAREVGGESGQMLQQGVIHFEDKRGVIEEVMFERILKVRPRLERFLPFLAITAAAAPLLGLLGTVIGMIKTFNLITIFGTGDARSLSSGISEALVTTELGLTVAIPVLILHGMLARYAKSKLASMEENAVAFVNGISTMK